MTNGEGLTEVLESFHEEEVHNDERWLISYADLMTLLFGAFVMLYSMVDQFDVIQQSAQKAFGGSTAQEKVVSAGNSFAAAKEKEALEIKIVRLETANYDLKSRLADLQNKPGVPVVGNAPSAAEVRMLKQERDELRAEVAALKRGIPDTATAPPPPVTAQPIENGDIPYAEGKVDNEEGSSYSPVFLNLGARASSAAGDTQANTVRISQKEILLDKPLAVTPGKQFDIVINYRGQDLTLKVTALPRGNGQASNRLAIVNPNGNGARLKEILKSNQPK